MRDDHAGKRRLHRRTYLIAAAGGAASLAGCAGNGDTDGGDSTGGTMERTATDTATGDGDEQSNAVEERGEPQRLDWEVFGYDRQNSGSVGTVGPAPRPDVSWEFETDYSVDGTLALKDETLYITSGGDGGGVLYALSADDGSKLWETDIFPLEDSTPAVSDGLVYVGGRDESDAGRPVAKLSAFDAESGAEVWTHTSTVAFAISAPPVPYDGTVYTRNRRNTTAFTPWIRAVTWERMHVQQHSEFQNTIV